ncbi:MAG: PQQ-binding-like beta-propeller repeat protein [Anaerolineales bacterium]
MIGKLPDLLPQTVLLLIGGALLVGCAGAGVQGASSWPGLASDGNLAFVANNQAVYAVELESGVLRWTYPTAAERGRAFYAPPGVSPDGLVFVGDFQNQITALDSADGSVEWGPLQLSTPNQRIIGSPAVAGEVLLITSSDGRLYARELNTGAGLWEFPAAASEPLEGGLWSAPVVSGDRVFLTALDHNLYVLDRATGDLLWNDPPSLGGAVADSPVLSNGLILVGTFAHQLRALDAERGSTQWSSDVEDWVWGAPAVGDGLAFFGDLSGVLHAVSLDNGAEAWRTSVGTSIAASPVYQQDRVYTVTENGVVSAREASTGAELWQRTLEGKLLSDPLLVGDMLLVASSSGEQLLTAFLTESGATRWSFTPSEGQ